MAGAGVDALILTNEKNIRYVTGFYNQGWISPTRARYVVIRLGDLPIAVIPSTNVVGFRELSWVEDVRHWSNPVGDEGVALVHEASARNGHGLVKRVALESGPESRWQATLDDLASLQAQFGDVEYHDAQKIMAQARLFKSDREIEIMSALAQSVTKVLDRPGVLNGAGTEQDIYFMLLEGFRSQRIERTPYLVVTSGDGGYEQINTGPLDRSLARGNLVCVDTGCSQKSYFCDVTRNFSIGPGDGLSHSIYHRLFGASAAGIKAARAGNRCCDVWAQMATALGEAAQASPVGRFGHGIGLDLTEGPSISASDRTVLQPGMTLAIEPSLVFERNGRRKIMVVEENLLVTDRDPRLLTLRTPTSLSVIEMSRS